MNPVYNINIHLPPGINDKNMAAALKGFADLMHRPQLPPPQAANLTPQPAAALEEKKEAPPRATVLDRLVEATKKGLKGISYPAFFVGAALLALGLTQTLFVLGTSFSLMALMESQALILLTVGGVLYKIGQDVMEEGDLNTVLGNLLYVVCMLPFMVRLGKL